MAWPICDDGIAIIKGAEGCVLSSYLCPAGVWTIGYGHTHDVRDGMSIDQEAAEQLLSADVQAMRDSVLKQCVGVPTPNQLAAMTSLTFNIGMANFRKSSVLRRHNEGAFAGAAAAFLLWNKATVNGRKVVLQGLVKRRQREAALYAS